jgi:hypothetical protein
MTPYLLCLPKAMGRSSEGTSAFKAAIRRFSSVWTFVTRFLTIG